MSGAARGIENDEDFDVRMRVGGKYSDSALILVDIFGACVRSYREKNMIESCFVR